ncbi:flavin-containing monooxygenase [Rhodopila sp.]|uniref:flavin-containing monooxygenase n=1 Tax=Rhodopila sp. TaxID=2480087 RepID=UPI002BAAA022|nr:NAD(P)/FAD-dependent oxidoreductase [Rhodopila sp.]HVZ07526.1 NAD(P)/FAD-dependent oxidoreductase [Rhodopila sp.]
MSETQSQPRAGRKQDPNAPAVRVQFDPLRPTDKPQDFYDAIKQKFAEARDLRLGFRPEGREQYTSDLTGELARYEVDPWAEEVKERDPITDHVECLFIGGGFSALLTAARLREKGVESIRIVERGSDVGGTWYWNRYPGAACDVSAYDYLPLLDEMGYIPPSYFAKGPEIFAHCQAIARRYDLYELAVFQTTVTSTVWDKQAKLWRIGTDRGDRMTARFVICANGTLSKPKLSRIDGMERFKGHSFHSSRFDYGYCGQDLSKLKDKVVGVIGTGASAVQIIPKLAKAAKALYVFQRTPSAIDIRDDIPTDPQWAASLKPGWQAERLAKHMRGPVLTEEQKAELAALPREEKIRRQENQNIDHQMRIHARVDEIVKDKKTAEALKPWYMHRCKRPTYDDEYLPTFNLPNVHLVDTNGRGITEITDNGPVFDGQEYPLDLLIYATGFEVQVTGIYNRILGEDGRELNEKYADGMRTVFGIHSSGYPNLFIMGGYQASFQFNLTFILRTQGDHIADCIDYTRKHGFTTIDATPDAEQWWVDEVIKHRGKTNRNKECTPGYYNFEGESNRRQDGNYNGGFHQYFLHMEDVRKEMGKHFVFG